MRKYWRALAAPKGQISIYLLVVVIAMLAGTLVAMRFAGERARVETTRHAEEALRLNAATLLGHLDKYRHLPALAGRRLDAQALAGAGFPAERMRQASKIVSEVQALSGAVDAAFLRVDGSIAVSATGFLEQAMPWREPDLVVAGLQGRLGRATVTGTSGRRAYVFVSPVRSNAAITALFAIAAPLESIEQSWALSSDPILALDRQGRLVAGNLLARENEVEVRRAIAEGWTGGGYVAYSRDLPQLGWRLHVLEPADAVLLARSWGAAVALLAGALASVAGLALLLRLQGERRSRRIARAAAIRLERQVRHRTRDLKAANAKLEIEVEERRAAETALRRAQDDLVQSAKLAAIGQMSAALAHEYNQPLAAIRSYSDNGLKFLARGDAGKAASNLERIARLVDRMATLSKSLKSFARRPRSEIVPVSLDAAMRDALLLAGHKAASVGVAIAADPVPAGLVVSAGHVRLSQVLVNLFSNAIDASVQTGSASVEVGVTTDETHVAICIRDHGPGIAEKDMASIFEPFFTTKEVGEGLGLGLSIAFNIVHEFSGRLEATNAAGGGAMFVVTLPRAARVSLHDAAE